MKKLIEQGSWNGNVSWKLYESKQLPDPTLITAVSCIAIQDARILLMRAQRGWGMVGGHVEDGETILEALCRESREEGGFTPKDPKLIGYREITAKVPISHPNGRKYYPFPISYIAYYWTIVNDEVVEPTGIEVLESKAFSFDEIVSLQLSDASTIELGWNAYLNCRE